MEAKSSIIAIGLTVHNTPVEIREKLSVPEVRCLRLVSAVFVSVIYRLRTLYVLLVEQTTLLSGRHMVVRGDIHGG